MDYVTLIGIAQLHALVVGEGVGADAGVEEVAWHRGGQPYFAEPCCGL